jgi:hypothetical protein
MRTDFSLCLSVTPTRYCSPFSRLLSLFDLPPANVANPLSQCSVFPFAIAPQQLLTGGVDRRNYRDGYLRVPIEKTGSLFGPTICNREVELP